MGKVQIGYFTNWGIYGPNYQPTDIKPGPLTHILYSFADINGDGTIKLTDQWADEQKPYTPQGGGTNLLGCLGELFLLKLKHRNLKVLLSVGGWTYSQNGHFNFVTDSGKRNNFVQSAVHLVENYGFDGIDIDYEYPSNQEQGAGFAALLTSLRNAFNQLSGKIGGGARFQLTAAVSCGESGYKFLDVRTMNNALDYWNLMAYDYASSGSAKTGHLGNLHKDQGDFSTDHAVDWYISKGASANKIVVGIPLYGRGFENTDGLYKPFSGTKDYTDAHLPLPGAHVTEDMKVVASYSYDAGKREFVSFDTRAVVEAKARYVSSKGLGGSMFWELSNKGGETLVEASAKVYGSLDQTQNHTHFPNSKWDNIRKH